VRALAAALSKNGEAWMTRAETAQALGKVRGTESFAALKANLSTKHPKVRRAVAAALGSFRTDEAAALLARAARQDDSYLVGADAARALGETRQKAALRTLVAVLKESSWADVKRTGALDGLASLGSDDGIPHVIERTRYGHASNARRAAVAALAKLSDDRKTREHLERLLDDSDPHFRIAVVSAIQTLGDARARGGLRRRLDRETDGRVMRRIREALRTLGHGPSAEHRRMSDEIEQLRRDLGDLKTRLTKIEDGRKKKPSRRRTHSNT
jgi:aminopeptidase N